MKRVSGISPTRGPLRVMVVSAILVLASALFAAIFLQYPTANQISSTPGWTTPNNAHANDGTYTTANPGKNSSVGTIYQFVFGVADIPDGSTINSTTVEIEYKVSTTASNATLQSQLFADSGQVTALSGLFSDTSEPTADYIVSYTATAQPTIAQLRSGIWVDLVARRGNSNTAVGFSCDFVRITVDYTPPVMSTTAGTLTASSSGCTDIAVTAPYTNDFDGDNSLTYRYQISGSGIWTSGSRTHSASPYLFDITGLTHGTTYDVEVTYVDADGVTGTNPQTVANILVGPNCTAAGTVTAAPTTGATPSIGVSAPFTFDNNGNNTLRYRTATPTGSGSWTVWTNLAHSASPYAFAIAGLTCGSSYDVQVEYLDADGIGSGTAVQTVSNIVLTNCTTAGTPSATVDSCTRITVSAPFTNDANANGATTFERGPAAGGPWTATGCGSVTGASPRICQDNGVSASSTYYYRVTYADADGVGGTAQQIIGPFNTPSCAVNTVATGIPTAAVDTCSQITVTSPYTDDANGNSTTTVEYNTSNSWPGTPACNAQSGASPRVCVVGSLLNNQQYWFRVTFADTDGVTGTNPQVIGPFTTRDCMTTAGAASGTVDSCTQITVSAPFTADWDADGSTAVRRGTAVGGPFGTVVCNALIGASPRTCVDSSAAESSTYYYQVDFTDADGVNGTDPHVIGPFTTPVCGTNNTTVGTHTATAASCKQITVTAYFTGDDNGSSTTLVEFKQSSSGTWLTGCGSLTGPSPRQCLIPGLSGSTSYDVRVDFTDGDGVSGTDPQTITPVTTPACGADQTAPMVLFLSPADGAVVGGTDRVKVQVYEPTAPAGGIASVQWKVDTGVLAPTALNALYACGTDCAVYEFSFDSILYANGWHYLTVVATDTAGNATTAAQAVKVNNAGGRPAGDGTLLRRSHGAQLCLDCHNLPTHSSQATGDKYGAWGLDCLACHTAHDTSNIYLIRGTIKTPNSGSKAITFWTDDRAGGTNPQNSYIGTYDAGGSPYDDGVCEACHTRTNHFRNDASGGDHTHNQGTRCENCHKHAKGFAGAACNGCHNAPPGQGSHAAHTINAVPSSYTDATPGSTAAEYGFACSKCHNATHVNDTHAGTPADPFRVEVAGESTVPDTTAMVYQGTYAGASTEQGPDGRYWAWDNRACSTVYCHGNFAGGTVANTYTWGTSNAACGDCHGASPASPPVNGEHDHHLTAGHGLAPINLACRDCHESVVDATPSVTDKAVHVNGGADWDLRRTNPQIGALATYSGVEAGIKTPPSSTYGQCSNLYCHSNGDPVNGPSAPYMVYRSIAWSPAPCTDCHTPPADPGCKGCHGFDTSGSAPIIIGQDAARKGSTSHVKHITPYGFMCHDCHSVSMLDRTVNRRNLAPAQTTHTNGQKDVDFSAWPVDQTGAAWEGINHTCSGLYCHSQGKAVSVPYDAPLTTADWDAGALGCNGCHDHAGAAATQLTAPHFMHTETDGYALPCERCHGQTVTGSATIASTALHVNVVKDRYLKSAPGGDADGSGYFSGSPTQCQSLYCHSNAAPLGGTDSRKTPLWNSTALTCASCHNTQARGDSGVLTDLSSAHGRHIQSTSGETGTYTFKCDECHAQVVRDNPNDPWALAAVDLATKANHVNGAHTVNFSSTSIANNINQSGGTYTQGPSYTCTGTYCHSGGVATSSPFSNTASPALAWNGSATCRSCHGWDAAAAPTIGVIAGSTFRGSANHGGHVANAAVIGTNYLCADCHNSVVSSGNSPITDRTRHVNGTKELFIATRGTYTGGATTPNCSTVYCHSSGQATPVYVPILWSAAAIGCNGCHGTGNALGRPDYASGPAGSATANSHLAHASVSADCAICHQGTTTNGTAIVLASTLHTDGSRQITWDATRTAAGASYITGSKTCSSTGSACHGAGAPQWGGTVTCRSCHMGTGAGDQDADDWTYGNGAIATIDGEDWRSYGHGRWGTDGNYQESNNTAANFDNNGARDGCLYCHTAGETHNTAANPFRLANIGAGNTPALKNGVCTVCHGGAGYNPGSGAIDAPDNIDATHYGVDHAAAGGDGGMFCWDCHDPHGDYNYGSTQRLAYMIEETPTEDHAGSSGTAGWGEPTTLASTPDFRNNRDGTAGWAYLDYVATATSGGTYRGVCQVCHDNTAHFRKSSLQDSGTHYNSGSPRCTASCHTHDQPPSDAFKPAGGDCKGCHGGRTGSIPRAAVVGGAAGSEGDDFIRASRHVSNGSAGAGNEIVTNFDCIVCHTEGDVTSTSASIKTLAANHGGDSGTTTVDLRNVDSSGGTGIQAAWPGKRLASFTATTAQRDSMDSFCMGCHDANGASNVAVNAANNGLETSTTGTASRRLTPFNTADTLQNSKEVAALKTWRAANNRVTDVKSQFNSTNQTGKAWASHHNLNQFKLRYETSGGNKATNSTTDWPTAAWTSYQTKEGVTLNAGTTSSGFAVGLHCSDCHLNEANAHGSRNTWYMLSDINGNDTAFTNVGYNTSTDICSKCHARTTYGMGNTDSTNSRTDAHNGNGARCDNIAWDNEPGFAYLGFDSVGQDNHLSCLGCHGGLEPGMIHGTNSTYEPWDTTPDGTGVTKRFRFMGTGGSMRWYSPTGAAFATNTPTSDTNWEGTSSFGCYTIGSADTWGTCTNHGTGRAGSTPNRARPLEY